MTDQSLPAVTIRVVPAPSHTQITLRLAAKAADDRGEETITYKGVVFGFKNDTGQELWPYYVLHGIDEPLPDLFGTELEVSRVYLDSEIPDLETFQGEMGNFWGPDDLSLIIDPLGISRSSQGKPTILASGRSLQAVIDFYRAGMTGQMRPSWPL